jgi:hypothetical protein
VSARGSKRAFDEPIKLPDGKKLLTLADGIAWLAKEVPTNGIAGVRPSPGLKDCERLLARGSVVSCNTMQRCSNGF